MLVLYLLVVYEIINDVYFCNLFKMLSLINLKIEFLYNWFDMLEMIFGGW